MGSLARLPLHPLLLAAYAVLFLYAANIGEVLPEDLLMPLLLALGLAAMVLALCALLYRDVRRGALLASALLVLVLFFGHLSAQLDETVLSETVQLALGVGLVVGAGLYAWRDSAARAKQYEGYARSHGGYYGKYIRRGDLFIALKAVVHMTRSLRRWFRGVVRRNANMAEHGRAYSLGLLPGMVRGFKKPPGKGNP